MIMDWKLVMLVIYGLSIGFFLGYLITAAVFVENSIEPKVIDNSLEEDLQLANDNLDYCKNALNKERSVAKELWNDYWDCLIPTWCLNDIEYCLEKYSNVTKESLEYMRLSCYYAENYEKYFERYE